MNRKRLAKKILKPQETQEAVPHRPHSSCNSLKILLIILTVIGVYAIGVSIFWVSGGTPAQMAPPTITSATMTPSTATPGTPATMASATVAPPTGTQTTITPATMAPSTATGTPATVAPPTGTQTTITPATMAPSTLTGTPATMTPSTLHGNSSHQEVKDIISEMITIAQLAEVGEDSVEYLHHILTQLLSGEIHAAIVGVMKAGKSTTINALIGQSFLPSAVEPETAARIRVVHSPSKPNGELWGISQELEYPVLLAEGQKDIHDRIHRLNTAERDGEENTSKYSKFVLKVPFKFLYDEREISFDLSDIPGLGGDASHISDQVQQTLKEISAFIILVDGRHMRLEAESNLFERLVELYPDLLTRLERVLVAVNIADAGHNLDASVKQRPEDIAAYVSKYLQIPDYAGVQIPPENILLVDARWALRSREWIASPGILTNPQDVQAFLGICGQIQTILAVKDYQDHMESVIEAIQAKHFSEDQLQDLCPHIEEISLITNFEDKLRTMLVHNGHKILLESAIDSALGEAKKLKSRMKAIEDHEQHNLTEWSALVQSEVELVDIAEHIIDDHTTVLDRLPQAVEAELSVQLTVLVSTMKDSINSKISTTLMEKLQNYKGSDNRETVHATILSTKPHVSNILSNEMKRSWQAACQLIQRTQSKVAKETCAQLKTQLLNSLSSQQTKAAHSNQPIVSLQVSTFLEKTSCELDRVMTCGSVTVLPDYPVSKMSAFPITDGQLCQHVVTGKETRYKRKRMVTRIWGIELGKYYVNEPYTVDVYKPNIPALQTALSSTLTKSHVEQFQSELRHVMSQTSTTISQKTKHQIESALAAPLKALHDNVIADQLQAALRASEQRVKLLQETLQELETLESQLREQYQ